jgi:hypothetical protein
MASPVALSFNGRTGGSEPSQSVFDSLAGQPN